MSKASAITSKKNIDCRDFPIPSFYYVDVCNICNLRCPFCSTGLREKGLTRMKMSFTDYKIILEKITPYAKHINLYNWGEPFLNDEIVPIISATASKNITTTIHSNLSSKDFTVEEAESIVLSGLSFLSVSLDGASQATYEKYRRGGSFQRVVNNIVKIQEAKAKHNVNMPVRWKFLVNAFNEHERESAIELAGKLKVNLMFKLMEVGDASWVSSLHNKECDKEGYIEQIYNDHILDNISFSPDPCVSLNKLTTSFCNQPFNEMLINTNGDVVPCCVAFGDEYSVGNLLTDEIEDVWQGKALRRCREFLLNYGPKQHTKSICETKKCSLDNKYIVKPNECYSVGNIEVLIGRGAWKEPELNWVWLSDNAEFQINFECTGSLFFDLKIPDDECHKTILPVHVSIALSKENNYEKTIEGVGEFHVKIPVTKIGQKELRICCNKYVVPDDYHGNTDMRKLSVIVQNFRLVE